MISVYKKCGGRQLHSVDLGDLVVSHEPGGSVACGEPDPVTSVIDMVAMLLCVE